MITTNKSFLEQRCRERGYRLIDVMGCVVAQDGDQWTIDETSPHYPRPRFPAVAAAPPTPTVGAGTELKKLLKRIGITTTENCSCNKRARIMDERGIEWVEANVPTVVGWLREEAAKRRLPFVDLAGAALVKMAIRNAKRNLAADV